MEPGSKGFTYKHIDDDVVFVFSNYSFVKGILLQYVTRTAL